MIRESQEYNLHWFLSQFFPETFCCIQSKDFILSPLYITQNVDLCVRFQNRNFFTRQIIELNNYSIFYIVTFLLSKQRVLESGKSHHFQKNEKFILYALTRETSVQKRQDFNLRFYIVYHIFIFVFSEPDDESVSYGEGKPQALEIQVKLTDTEEFRTKKARQTIALQLMCWARVCQVEYIRISQ